MQLKFPIVCSQNVPMHFLSQDSPSNKLLFAKDIPKYRSWVARFYKSVQDMPPVSEQEMTNFMTEMSMVSLRVTQCQRLGFNYRSVTPFESNSAKGVYESNCQRMRLEITRAFHSLRVTMPRFERNCPSVRPRFETKCISL